MSVCQFPSHYYWADYFETSQDHTRYGPHNSVPDFATSGHVTQRMRLEPRDIFYLPFTGQTLLNFHVMIQDIPHTLQSQANLSLAQSLFDYKS